jgi:hypothetical protein
MALLVAWLLLEEQVEELRREMTQGDELSVALSSWHLSKLAWQGLQQVIQGDFDPSRVKRCAPRLRRLLVETRKRPLLEHQRRLAYTHRLAQLAGFDSLFSWKGA